MDEELFKSDGVTITAEVVNIGGDIVGRDRTALAPMGARPPAEAEAEPVFRTLVIVSRPLDVSELPTIADQWELVRGLAGVEAPVRVKVLRPPTIEGLRAELLNGYQVVHFDGHGDFGRVCPNCGALVSSSETEPARDDCPACRASLADATALGLLFFEKEDGTFDPLPAQELAELIAAVPGRPTKLFVLSACRSAMGGEDSLAQTLVDGGVPAVLGMKEVVTVGATLAFMRPLYAALGTGATIAEATDIARPALKKIPNPVLPTPTAELLALFGPGVDERLCPKGSPKGRVQIDPDRLVGVPDAPNFYGTFMRGDPPQGRKGLLTQLARVMLNGERLIVLTGAGGIGKTALAAIGARRLAWRFSGGVFWRSAAGIADFRLDHLLDAFAIVFGQQFYTLPTPAKRDLVLNYLGDLRTTALIVVDNAETITDPAVWKFLTELPAPSAALVTAREAPQYGGLTLPVGGMAPEEGVGFFVDEVRRAKNHPAWGSRLAAEDHRLALEICRLLDGHPLALLIAAAMLRGMDLAGVLAQVKANPARGEVGRRFDFSYNRLADADKELLHRMAAFASRIRPQFLEILCTDPDFGGDSQLANWQTTLFELVRKSFVERHELSGEDADGNSLTISRYRLHPVMRQYAAGKAGLEAMRRHHYNAAQLLLAYARQFKQDFDALEIELPNLLGAMDWADEEQRTENGQLQELAAKVVTGMAGAIADPVSGILGVRGHWNEARQRLAQAADAARQIGNADDETAFVANAALVAQNQGDMARARSEYERVKAIFEEAGRRDRVAAVLHNLAMVAQDTGDLAEARRLYDQSLTLKRELGDRLGIAHTLNQLGILAQATGDPAEARRLYNEAGQIFDELNAKQEKAAVLNNLGVLVRAMGDLAEARRLYDQSLQLARELGSKQGVANLLHQLGTLSLDTGDLAEAHRLYNQSLDIKRELGDKRGIANTLHQLGCLEQIMGNLAEARGLYNQSLEINRELGDKQGIAQTLHQLAILAQDTGNLVEARRLYDQSLGIARELGNKQGIAETLHQLGLLARDTGDLAEARLLHEQSLEIARELGNKLGIAATLHQLGRLSQATGDLADARRLYDQSLGLARELGDKRGIAVTLHNLATAAQATGDLTEARRLYDQSLSIRRELGDKQGIASTLHNLGRLAEEEGNLAEAARLFEESLKLLAELGSPDANVARQSLERVMQRIDNRFA